MQDLIRISTQCRVKFVPAASISGLALTLFAVLAGALGVWRLGADPGWTGPFFLAGGLFSRYQLWFAAALGAQTSAFILNRWVIDQTKDLTAGFIVIPPAQETARMPAEDLSRSVRLREVRGGLQHFERIVPRTTECLACREARDRMQKLIVPDALEEAALNAA